MIPHYDAAPFRQQRWIELENIGALVIPPYACVEILNAITLDAVRTVLQVGRVRQDDISHTVINGPLAIPSGGRGYAGTMDDPMYARVDASMSAGTLCGPVRDQWHLASGRSGYVALGDFTAISPGGVLRVMRAARPGGVLVELCARENAARNQPYRCLRGEWNPANGRWCYSGASPTVWAIDHRFGTLYAETDWKGLYQEMPANMTVGTPPYQQTITSIWVCVSLDCAKPPEGCTCN